MRRVPALAATAASASALCLTDHSAGLHSATCPAGFGSTALVTYNVPAQCLSAPCGVIMNVHGFSMTGLQQEQGTQMIPQGEKYGYIILEPTNSESRWARGDDDPMFAVFQEAVSVPEWKVDRHKLHFMGFSLGGGMTWRQYAKHPDYFASVVAMSFGLGEVQVLPEAGPVLYEQGTNDHICWYNGISGICQEGAPATVQQVLTNWSVADQTGTVVASDSHYTRTRYIGSQGTPFEFIKFDYQASYFGKGHCLPGSPSHPCNGTFCCGSDCGYSIGEEAMQWFLKYPKKNLPPAPTPPAPSGPTYVCVSHQCVAGAGGIPEAQCIAVCGGGPAPPAQLYTCSGGKCVASASGLPKQTCDAACGGV